MAQIQPFHGIYFSPSRLKLGDVLCPPYDVISPVHQEELYARHEKNAVRLELAKEVDRYGSAQKTWREWLSDGTLLRDAEPSIYLLCQTFRGKAGETVRRKGFLALCELEDPDSKKILPHEKTFPKPKEDRLRLLSQTRAQFSPIFSLYSDESNSAGKIFSEPSKSAPFLKGEFQGVSHEVWKISEKETIDCLQRALQNTQVFIADGHHRYETALDYQRIQRRMNPLPTGSEGYNYTLMYFSNVEDEGLVIYPIHRVIRGLKNLIPGRLLSQLTAGFTIESFESIDKLRAALESKTGEFACGVVIRGDLRYHLLTSAESSRSESELSSHLPPELQQLDVVILHTHVIPRIVAVDGRGSQDHVHIDFPSDETEAVNAVRNGSAQVAILLNPVQIAQLQAVARAGLTMPQKSTFFYPKLPAGLVMYDLERGLNSP